MMTLGIIKLESYMLNFFMEMLVLGIQYLFKNTDIEINKLKLRIIDNNENFDGYCVYFRKET